MVRGDWGGLVVQQGRVTEGHDVIVSNFHLKELFLSLIVMKAEQTKQIQ